ncbi:CU044_5270 family protein [Actinomadura sp. 21ATH]|uniref:CU044_5270 family protein n=1 Tax=Actinomadura sp. 21ATH TaxID=1735444 RepID=UPI0035BF38A1
MNDDQIALIARHRPEVPTDPAARARARAHLQRELAPGRRRARAGRRAMLLGGLAATAAAAVAVAQFGASPESAPGGEVDLRTLELAAATVERQAAPARPTPDQWIYTRTKAAYALQSGNVAGREAMLKGKVTVEEWWKFDGKQMASSVQNQRISRSYIMSPGEKRRPGVPRPGFNGGDIGGPAIWSTLPNKTYDYVASLPAEPGALLARVRKDHRDAGRDVTTFGVIAGLFRENHLIPPEKNAALYRALAKIPGVRVKKNVKDYAGRTGIGVLFGRDRQGEPRVGIILDPRTYRYMGDPQFALLHSAVVDRMGQRE